MKFLRFSFLALSVLLIGMVFLAAPTFAFNGPSYQAGVGSGAIGVDTANDVSIGTSTPNNAARFLIVASTTAAPYSFDILNAVSTPIFTIDNNGSTTISGTVTASAFVGALNGNVNAANISSGQFGSNTGGGNYTFPSNVYFPGSGIWNSSGNVGIGTATPAHLLDVNGTADIQGGLAVGTTTTQSTGNALFTGTVTAAGFSGPLTSTESAANISSGQFGANTGGGNYSFPGSVGIGTTGPATKLDVSDNVSIRSGFNLGSTTIGSSATSAPLYVLAGNQNSGVANSPAGGFGIVGGNNISSPIVWMYANPGTNAFQVRSVGWNQSVVNASVLFDVDDSGNVGIGTTNPGANLEIDSAGTTNFTTPLHVFAPNLLAGNIMQMRLGVAASNYNTAEIRFYYAGASSTSNRLDLGLYGTPGLLSILGNGKIGIGTTNPVATLSVNGSIDVANNRITSVAAPINNSDAANKAYVDALRSSFVGVTPTTYTGNLGGIPGANSDCNAYSAGSHMCSLQEYRQTGATNGASCWINDDALTADKFAVTSGYSECNYWSSNSGSVYGSILGGTYSCSNMLGICCCR